MYTSLRRLKSTCVRYGEAQKSWNSSHASTPFVWKQCIMIGMDICVEMRHYTDCWKMIMPSTVVLWLWYQVNFHHHRGGKEGGPVCVVVYMGALEYWWDMCRLTKGVHIEHLLINLKCFLIFWKQFHVLTASCIFVTFYSSCQVASDPLCYILSSKTSLLLISIIDTGECKAVFSCRHRIDTAWSDPGCVWGSEQGSAAGKGRF